MESPINPLMIPGTIWASVSLFKEFQKYLQKSITMMCSKSKKKIKAGIKQYFAVLAPMILIATVQSYSNIKTSIFPFLEWVNFFGLAIMLLYICIYFGISYYKGKLITVSK